MKVISRNQRSLQRLAICVAFATLAIMTTACSAASGSFDRTLHVTGPVTMRVATGAGNIHVMPGTSNSVHIVGHIHAFGPFNAQARVKSVENNPPIQQTGNIINIGRHAPNHVAIDYDITVPPGTELAAHTGSGNLRFASLSGSVNASTGSGNIQASGLGGHVVLHTGSGNIRAGFTQANDVKAQTGSGNIILTNIQSMLVAQTGSGNIEVQGTPFGGWNLKTGSGNVTIHAGSAHYAINATTGSGALHTSQSLSTHGTLNRHHVVGDINGGGPMVHIVTGSGNIRLH